MKRHTKLSPIQQTARKMKKQNSTCSSQCVLYMSNLTYTIIIPQYNVVAIKKYILIVVYALSEYCIIFRICSQKCRKSRGGSQI